MTILLWSFYCNYFSFMDLLFGLFFNCLCCAFHTLFIFIWLYTLIIFLFFALLSLCLKLIVRFNHFNLINVIIIILLKISRMTLHDVHFTSKHTHTHTLHIFFKQTTPPKMMSARIVCALLFDKTFLKYIFEKKKQKIKRRRKKQKYF